MIVDMEKIRIVSSQAILNDCITILQKSGCIHIIKSQADKFLSESGLETGVLQKEVAEKLHLAESMLFGVNTALTIIKKTHPLPEKNLVKPQDKCDWSLEENCSALESAIKEIQTIDSSIRSLSDELNEIRQYRNVFEEFQPLIEQMKSLHEVEVSGIFFQGKEVTAKENIERLESSLSKATKEAYSIFKGAPKDHGTPCLLVYPVSTREAVEKKVFKNYRSKIEPLHIPQRFEQQTYASTLSYLFKREKDAEQELKVFQEKLHSYADKWMSRLQSANHWFSFTLDRLKVQNYLALSKTTFWISGWIPANQVAVLREQLDYNFKGAVFFYTESPSPEEFKDVPVLLKNSPGVKPFERLLSFFPLPIYGSVDPTTLIMLFFPLFFGLMLGDVGYAIIMGTISWMIGRYKRGSIFWKDIRTIITACAITTGLFGILFGEFFGKFWFAIGLPHPLFDRKVEIIHFLVAVIFLGGLHLSIGNIVACRLSILKGYIRHSLNQFSNIIIIGSTVWIIGMTLLGKTIQPAPFILLGGFTLKVFFGKAIDLFESIRLFSNLLSYARLMALGLASVILADLADDIYILSGGVFLGILGAFGVHILNFILGVFSPTIQSIRLHYVEFFNQFYEPGVVKFNPLKEHLE